jgi:hypothetical protein
MEPETFGPSPPTERPGRKQRHRSANGGRGADPAAQKALSPVVEALTDPDEGRRQTAVAEARLRLPFIVLRMLAKRLVDLLSGDDEVLRRQASASLIGLGRPAVWPLCIHLLTVETVPLQLTLIRILGGIAPTLDEEERTPVQGVLMRLLVSSPEEAMIEACMDAMAPFREPCEGKG